jgi:ABC-2 type transport system permease protein
MDGQNTPFPVVVNRDVGGLTVQEIQAVDYPFFVDIRQDGMELKSPILANVPAVTLNWASPLTLALPDDSPLEATVLLRSTEAAWLRTDPTIQPDFQLYPELGFPVEGEQSARTLAVSLQGDFTSYFAGKAAPSAADPSNPEAAPSPSTQAVLQASASPGRLVVIGSAEFLDDFVLDLSSRIVQDRYLNNLTFVQNAIDWAVEDLELLSIRSRGTFTRVLAPLEQEQQTAWEVGNYAAALALLLAVYLAWQARRRGEQPLVLVPDETLIADAAQPGQEVSHD